MYRCCECGASFVSEHQGNQRQHSRYRKFVREMNTTKGQSSISVAPEIERLKSLLRSGSLTEQEYQVAIKQTLAARPVGDSSIEDDTPKTEPNTKVGNSNFKYVVIGFGVIALLAAVLFANADRKKPVSTPVKVALPLTEVQSPKPLNPMFSSAQDCLLKCVGYLTDHNPDAPVSLPLKFEDFLSDTDYGMNGLLSLVRQFPSSYMPLVVKGPSERESMGMEGWLSYVMDYQGDHIQVYTNAGFPDQEWVNHEEYRRISGHLNVAVNPRTKAMAAIFNGQKDLSEYRFAGDEKLLPVLLSYAAARDSEIEKSYSAGSDQAPDQAIFPVPADRIQRVQERITHLNDLFIDGYVTGARSVYADSQKSSPEKRWWSADSAFAKCIETGGPAARLDKFVGFTDKPYTKDFRSSSGTIVKVEVINPSSGDNTTVWTYYRAKDQCEAEQVNATKSLAEKYR